ncbi:MAG: hypothetical protein H0T46_12230 [Deltaproteobacteria bacterium]|nr:hypothetical protein [Deltaproteobacteria bacterium]
MQAVGMMIALVGCAAACSKKADDGAAASKDKPVAVAYSAKQVGSELDVTLTAEPRTHLYVAPDRGGSNPKEKVTDDTGTAVFRVGGASGENSLFVVATALDGRKTEHKFPFTIGAQEKLEVSDAIPSRPGETLVGCQGSFDAEAGGVERVDLCTGLRLAEDGTVGLAFKAPSARKLTIGAQTFEPKDGVVVGRIDLTPAIAALDLQKLRDRERPFEYPVTLELASGTRKGTVELDRTAVSALLSKVQKGPVLFPGEAKGGGQASLLLLSENLTWEYIGEDVPIARLDLVAVMTSKLRKAASCRYVATDGSEKQKSLDRVMRDPTVTVYERRTGKKVATKSWTAKVPECADWIKSNTPGSYADVDEREIVEWLKTLLPAEAGPPR